MSGTNSLAPPWWMGIWQQPQNTLAPQPTWADAMDANARLIAEQRQRDVDAGLIDPATGWPTRQGAQQSAMTTLLGLGTSDTPGIRAYHGSPHSFDAFDASKIGTGEGAQAFGHGLYFADNEGVALNYRDRLSGDAPGHMYEVNINAPPEHFLDWDKPLSEQSQHVQDKLGGVWEVGPYGRWPDQKPRPLPSEATGQTLYRMMRDDPAATAQALSDAGIPGIRYLDAQSRALPRDLEHIESSITDRQQQIAMLQHEIDANQNNPGLLPPFFSSRQATIAQHQKDIAALQAQADGLRSQKTSNTVVFDPATIEILRKYGIAGLGLGLGAAATQGSNQ